MEAEVVKEEAVKAEALEVGAVEAAARREEYMCMMPMKHALYLFLLQLSLLTSGTHCSLQVLRSRCSLQMRTVHPRPALSILA